MKIAHNFLFVVFIGCLLFTSAASLRANPIVTDLSLVSEKRINRTTFEYTYKVTFKNDGVNRTDLKATASGAGAGTTIVEGEVVIGSLSPNQVISPADTITLRQDRLTAFDRSALVWVFNEATSTTGVLLPGSAHDLALTALYNHITKLGVPVADIATDSTGVKYALTRIDVEFDPMATVGQVNAALLSVSGGIVSMIANNQFVVVEIPNPGTLAALDGVIATLKTSPGIINVRKAGFLEIKALPPALSLTGSAPIKHHLAIRAHAAWNVLDSFSAKLAINPPLVLMSDAFGAGDPGFGFNVNYTSTDFATGNPDPHGYHVLGIMGADWNDIGTNPVVPPAGLAGMIPGGFPLRVIEILQASGHYMPAMATLQALLDMAQQQAALNPLNKILINYSLGYPCDADAVNVIEDANTFIQSMTNANLTDKVLFMAAAGNIDPCWTQTAEYASPATAAALRSDIVDSKGIHVPSLDNIFVVENVIADGSSSISGPILGPVCTNDNSVTAANHIGHASRISGIGTNVFSLNIPGIPPIQLSGTSISAPQVTGLAIWLLSLDPTLSIAELKSIIKETANSNQSPNFGWACNSVAMAPVVDAYAATLALDKKDILGPIRRALFDVARADYQTVSLPSIPPDGRFDTADLRLWTKELLERNGKEFDYSRYDLNGDGKTGAPMRGVWAGDQRSFDLDADGILDVFVAYTIEGVTVIFNENDLTDAEILCYYAYSPLYTGDPFERTVLMIPILDQCGVKLDSVAVTIGGAAIVNYTVPTMTTIQGFEPPITPWNGIWFGAGTCVGEEGPPVWSSNVESGSFFLPATQVINPPVPTIVHINRDPCSSFFAVKDGKIWFNATGREFKISSVTSDKEYQARYFSDPLYFSAANPKAGRDSTWQLQLGFASVFTSGLFIPNAVVSALTSNTVDITFAFK